MKDFFPDDFPVYVNDIEVKNGSTIPTYFLMKRLETEYPDYSFYFIIGSDLIPTLRLWDEGDKLLEEIKFIVYNRVGYEVEIYINNPESQVSMPKQYLYSNTYKDLFGEVSSTLVRNRIKEAR